MFFSVQNTYHSLTFYSIKECQVVEYLGYCLDVNLKALGQPGQKISAKKIKHPTFFTVMATHKHKTILNNIFRHYNIKILKY